MPDTTSSPPPDLPPISPALLRAEAARLRIKASTLRRLKTAEIVAKVSGGAYPNHVLAQLRVVADAHAWTTELVDIRHAVWWAGAPIENWSR